MQGRESEGEEHPKRRAGRDKRKEETNIEMNETTGRQAQILQF